MSVIEITLRIRQRKPVPGAGSPLVLQLVDSRNGSVVEDDLPEDLKLPNYQDDYKTFRKTFVNEAGEKSVFAEIGRHLLAVLRFGNVGEQLKDLKANRNKGETFRVLLDIEPEELKVLPWELLLDGPERLFQRTAGDSIVRVHDYGPTEATEIEPINWPMRLLVVIGVDDSAIKADDEVQKIEDGLRTVDRLVDVEILKYPTIDQLEKECKKFRPHVFHYVGHGGLTRAQDPCILLQRAGGGNDFWTAAQIENSLQTWKWIPRFAFINACRTAGSKAATAEDETVVWGINDAFHVLSVPAVLTMQADIRGNLAGEFAGVIYEKLAAGEPIDRAVAAARVKLRNATVAQDKDLKRDWATPTLTISIPPESVLPLKPKASTEREEAIRACEKFQEVSLLANCRVDRRKFIHGFYPLPQGKPKNLMIVRGPARSGKTWITLWCLAACAMQNHDVRYVEVTGNDSPKWLDVLTRIQDGNPSKVVGGRYQIIYKPLPKEAFYEFNHELRFRIKNETPPEWDQKPVEYEKPDLSDLDNLPENMGKDIIKSFQNALIKAARPHRDLIIVLDRFTYSPSGLSEPHMNFLIKHLFEDAAVSGLKSKDGTQNVKFVLVMSNDELEITYKKKELNKLAPYWHDVELQGIPAQDYRTVMCEFFRIIRTSTLPDIQKLASTIVDENEEEMWIRKYHQGLTDPWQPSLLGDLHSLLQRFAMTRR